MINITGDLITYQFQYIKCFKSFLFGSFGILAFSPYNFWPASIVSCTNLLTNILQSSTWKHAAWHSFFWGIGFFSNGLYWIHISIARYSDMHCCISIFLMFLLILYLTLFPVLFAIILINIIKLNFSTWDIAIFSPILWSIVEHLRGYVFTEFPWLQFGYTQIDGPLKGIAPILGVEGITFFIILISAFLALFIKTTQFLPLLISISILFFLWPLQWICWYHTQPQNSVHITLVQGNIDKFIQWNINYVEKIIKTYLTHTFSALGKTKIIIWPESAIPGNEVDYKNFLTLLDCKLRQHHTSLITGIIGTRSTNIGHYYYNSIIVLGNNEPYKYPNHNRYDKHHLVLFSEKLPLQNFLNPLLTILNISTPFYIQKGHYLQPQLKIFNLKITSAICYEIIFGNQIRKNFKSNTNFLLTIANDAWFGHSIGPWQHFQITRMRALELGRPLLCSTNNGITAIINPDGTVNKTLPQFTSAILGMHVIPTIGMTFYAKFGPCLFWCYSVIMSLIMIIIFHIKKQLIKN